MLAWRPAQVFLLGDNIYDRGSRKYIASRYDDIYAPLMKAGVAFHAALGNHDVLWCEVPQVDPLPDDARAYVPGLLPCDVRYQLRHPSFGYIDGKRYYSVKSDGGPRPLVEVFILDSNTLKSSPEQAGPLRTDRADAMARATGAGRLQRALEDGGHPRPAAASPASGTEALVPIGGVARRCGSRQPSCHGGKEAVQLVEFGAGAELTVVPRRGEPTGSSVRSGCGDPAARLPPGNRACASARRCTPAGTGRRSAAAARTSSTSSLNARMGASSRSTTESKRLDGTSRVVSRPSEIHRSRPPSSSRTSGARTT